MRDKAIAKEFKAISNYILMLICSIIVGFMLILLAYSINTDSIRNHIEEDISRLKQETNYYNIFNGKICGCTQDNYTEAIYLGQALLNNADGSLVKSSLTGRFINEKNGLLVDGLSNYIQGNLVNVEYDSLEYFWNGWLVVLKPLLVFFSYSEIRYLNLVLQTLLVFFIMNLLYKKNLREIQFPFLFACLFMNPITLGVTMTFSGFYYIMLIATYIVIKYNDTLLNKNLYGLFFTFIGIVVFYFDMNYFQLCTVGIPLALYFYMNNNKSVKDMLIDTIKLGGAWLFGFLGMMLGKWLIYAIFVDFDIFVKQFQHILSRTGTSIDGITISRLGAISHNIAYGCCNKFLIILELLYVVYAIYFNKKNKKKLIKNMRMLISFAAVALIAVFMRYFLEANHSYIHACFVYRNLAICTFTINNVLAATMVNDGEHIL